MFLMGAHAKHLLRVRDERGARRHARRQFILTLALVCGLAPMFGARAQQQGAAQTDERALVVVQNLRAAPVSAAAREEARSVAFDFLRAGNYEAAEQVFRALREVASADRVSRYGNALALFNLKRLEEAEVLAREAADPFWMSAASREAKPPATAGKDGSGVAEARRLTSDALVLLGVIRAVRGDNKGALAAVEQAALLEPENFDAQFALGRARYGAGDPASAARAFRAAVALRPADAQARFFLATSLEGAGDDAGALAAYGELVTVAPDAPEGHMGVGVLLVKKGAAEDVEEGIRELARALAQNPNLYEARVTIGRALIRQGRAAESIEHLKRAAELAPRNPEPHYQLAIAYRRLGRRQEADAESAVVKKLHEAHRGTSAQPGAAASSTKEN